MRKINSNEFEAIFCCSVAYFNLLFTFNALFFFFFLTEIHFFLTENTLDSRSSHNLFSLGFFMSAVFWCYLVFSITVTNFQSKNCASCCISCNFLLLIFCVVSHLSICICVYLYLLYITLWFSTAFTQMHLNSFKTFWIS